MKPLRWILLFSLLLVDSTRAGQSAKTEQRVIVAQAQGQEFEEDGVDEEGEELDWQEPRRPTRRRVRSGDSRSSSSDVGRVFAMLKRGQSERASEELFEMSRSSSLRDQRDRIRYLLGLALMEMGLNQVAAFQFVSIVKEGGGRFVDQSLSKLSVVASEIGDSSLVDYAVSRVSEGGVPRAQRDILNYRTGEFLLRKRDFISAAKTFARVGRGNSFYHQAKYKEGLAWASAGQEMRALRAFNSLIRDRSDADITDTTLVTAKLAKARVYYQRKDWERAIEAYRDIPRDSAYWHETVFEQSWAYFMSAQFRSVLSNFHTLHSPYYEQFFIPESLVLRAIVYLYICNYDEMKKVVQLFEKIYVPVLNDLKSSLKEGASAADYFEEFSDYLDAAEKKEKYRGRVPGIVWKHLMKDGELRQLYTYFTNLRRERARWNGFSTAWKTSEMGDYAKRAIQKRMDKSAQKIGARIADLLVQTRDSLQDLFEQSGFLQFEMVNAQKEKLKKQISGRALKSKKRTIDEQEERDFYIQNGYDYWPFQGEYWLDELGNYHFLGVQSCE